jgi:hypothetical protein
MRANDGEQEFADWVLKLGNGEIPIFPNSEEAVLIPAQCLTDDIVNEIYGEAISVEEMENLETMSIVSPLNEDCLRLNEEILLRHEGEMQTYFSSDGIVIDSSNEGDDTNYPTEFLNSLTPSGFPPHELNLKIGSPIMLLRNINKKRGLCNGTRLIVKGMLANLITAEVVTGTAKGESVFIPRIILNETDDNMPVRLRRRQFPIRLAYCMTINKSQGQSFDNIGIYLPKPVFSHGQLYVAFSRGRSFAGVKVQVSETSKQGNLSKGLEEIFTPNIVYHEVLQ